MATKRKFTQKRAGLKHGFKSGLEERINRQLESYGVFDVYEKLKIKYTVPARQATYTPDWILPNGVIVESKGRFVVADRQKHLFIKAQHPELDIRFVFSNSKAKISKTSQTTYAMWCDQHCFKYADKEIPSEWLNERKRSG
jgi:Phage endonuclease I